MMKPQSLFSPQAAINHMKIASVFAASLGLSVAIAQTPPPAGARLPSRARATDFFGLSHV